MTSRITKKVRQEIESAVTRLRETQERYEWAAANSPGAPDEIARRRAEYDDARLRYKTLLDRLEAAGTRGTTPR